MRDTLVEAMSNGHTLSVGDVFNGLDAAMRRPVEILGLLQIAAQLDSVDRSDLVESFSTVRADGTRRSYTLPRITVNTTATTTTVDGDQID